MTRTALVMLDGSRPARETLIGCWDRAVFRICADGAAAACLEYDLRPDVIIGDFDSIDSGVIARLSDAELIHDPDQETTDSEKAIQFAIDQGYRRICLLGALGKRMDHGLYNLGLLWKYHQQLDDLIMVADDEQVFLISGHTSLSAAPGSRISLLPLFGPVENVNTQGLQYPIRNKRLAMGRFASVSNRFLQSTASISIGSGSLLVVMERSAGDALTCAKSL